MMSETKYEELKQELKENDLMFIKGMEYAICKINDCIPDLALGDDSLILQLYNEVVEHFKKELLTHLWCRTEDMLITILEEYIEGE